jgi:hypothetical protein
MAPNEEAISPDASNPEDPLPHASAGICLPSLKRMTRGIVQGWCSGRQSESELDGRGTASLIIPRISESRSDSILAKAGEITDIGACSELGGEPPPHDPQHDTCMSCICVYMCALQSISQ